MNFAELFIFCPCAGLWTPLHLEYSNVLVPSRSLMSSPTRAWSPAAGGRAHLFFTSALDILGSLRNWFPRPGNPLLDLLEATASKTEKKKESVAYVFIVAFNERCLLWFMTALKGDLNAKFPKLVVRTNAKKKKPKRDHVLMIPAAIKVSLSSAFHLSTSAKQTDPKACPDDSSALLAADTWTRGCLGRKKGKGGRQPLRRCWTSRPLWPTACHPSLCHV